MFKVPTNVFMPNVLLQAIYNAFAAPKTIKDQQKKDFDEDSVKNRIPEYLALQKYLKHLLELIVEVNYIVPDVFATYRDYRAKLDTRRKANATIKGIAGTSTSQASLS